MPAHGGRDEEEDEAAAATAGAATAAASLGIGAAAGSAACAGTAVRGDASVWSQGDGCTRPSLPPTLLALRSGRASAAACAMRLACWLLVLGSIESGVARGNCAPPMRGACACAGAGVGAAAAGAAEARGAEAPVES